MKPFTVYNYSCCLGPGMALPAAAAQLKTRRAHSEPTQSKHTRRRIDTMPRPVDTPFEAVFLTLRATHKLLSKLQLFFFPLLFFFSVFFLAFLLLIYGTKIMLYCPVQLREAEQPLLAGSVWDYTVMWALGLGLFGSVKNRCALSKEINDEFVGNYFEKPKFSSQYMFTRAFVCRFSQKVRPSQRKQRNKELNWPQGGSQFR